MGSRMRAARPAVGLPLAFVVRLQRLPEADTASRRMLHRCESLLTAMQAVKGYTVWATHQNPHAG